MEPRACNLNALTPEEQSRRAELFESVGRSVRRVEELPDGYRLVAGDELVIVEAAEVVGRFSSVELPPLPGGLGFEIRYDRHQVRLVVEPRVKDEPKGPIPSDTRFEGRPSK